jgi:hypothetical protein
MNVCGINLDNQIGAKCAACTLWTMSDTTVPHVFETYLCIWVSINESEFIQCYINILRASLCIPERDRVLKPHIRDGAVPTFPHVAAPIVKCVLNLEAVSPTPPLSNWIVERTTAMTIPSFVSSRATSGNVENQMSSAGSWIMLFVPNGSICLPAQLNRAGTNVLRHFSMFLLDSAGGKGRSDIVGLVLLGHFDPSSLPSLSVALVSLASTIPIYFSDDQPKSTRFNLDITCAVARAPTVPLSAAPL